MQYKRTDLALKHDQTSVNIMLETIARFYIICVINKNSAMTAILRCLQYTRTHRFFGGKLVHWLQLDKHLQKLVSFCPGI